MGHCGKRSDMGFMSFQSAPKPMEPAKEGFRLLGRAHGAWGERANGR